MLAMFERLSKYLKRSYHIQRRNHNNRLTPVRITKRNLADSRLHYERLLEDIWHDLETFQAEDRCFDISTKAFSGYSILSYNGDRMGKVLRFQGEIYRGIYPNSVGVFKKLWSTGLLQVLSARGMIPVTTLTQFSTEDYPIVIRHETVSISPSSCWSYDMIRDAAILICIIKKAAELVGFTLHDGHLNNVTFDGGRPVFTDIGSFVENKGQYTSCNKEVLFTACYRLIAYHLGNSILNRLQLYDESNNAIWVQPIEYDDLTREYVCLLKQFLRYHTLHSSPLCTRIIRRMFFEREVLPECIDLLFPSYPETEMMVDKNLQSDIQIIKSMVRDLPIRSCGDIGGNQGVIVTELASSFGWKARALEYQQDAARETYIRIKKLEQPINTFMFNYCFGTGVDTMKSIVSDLFIAYDITNNCSIRQYYRLDSLLSSLNKLSQKYVLVTYYPNRKLHPRYVEREGSAEEKIDYFARKFSEFFQIISQEACGASFDSEDYRVIFLGEKTCAI